jgi:hypothetical protein
MASSVPSGRRPTAQVICMLTWAKSCRRRNRVANNFVRVIESRKNRGALTPIKRVWMAKVVDIVRYRLAVAQTYSTRKGKLPHVDYDPPRRYRP